LRTVLNTAWSVATEHTPAVPHGVLYSIYRHISHAAGKFCEKQLTCKACSYSASIRHAIPAPFVSNIPFTRYNRLSNRLLNLFDNRFDNRVERSRTATVRSTGCQTGLYNRLKKHRVHIRPDNVVRAFYEGLGICVVSRDKVSMWSRCCSYLSDLITVRYTEQYDTG